eukprot:3456565-Pyramimonas_sp.AAC.1
MVSEAKGWARSRRRSLGSLASGDHWPQCRLFKHGLAESAARLRRGDPEGSLWHRACECPALSAQRREGVSVF